MNSARTPSGSNGFFFVAPPAGHAVFKAARLIEPLGGGQVDHAAVPRRQGYAATAINHDVVEDPAKPGAHAVDPVDVDLAGEPARIAADAEAPLDRCSVNLDAEDALARLQVVSSVGTPGEAVRPCADL